MNAHELSRKIIENCKWNIEELEREKLRIEGKIEAFQSIQNLTESQILQGE